MTRPAGPAATGWAALGRAWRWDRVPGRVTLAAGPARTAVEAALLGLLAAMTAEAPPVPDFRLVVLTLAPAALLALVWAAVRLRPSGAAGGRRFGRLAARSLACGGGVALGGLLVAALGTSLENAGLPVPPSLFGPGASGLGATVEGVASLLLAGAPPLPSGTPALLVGAVRLVGYSLAAAGAWALLRLVAAAVAVPARAIKRQVARRLLWRLTLSHFGVVGASLATALVGTLLLLAAAGSAQRILTPPAPGSTAQITAPSSGAAGTVAAGEAQQIADAIAAEERAGGPLAPADLAAFAAYRANAAATDLPGLAARLNALGGRARRLADALRAPSLLGADFVVLTDGGGQVVASSDAARFVPGSPVATQAPLAAAQASWQAVLARAAAGETDPARLAVAQAGPQLVLGGAAPVRDPAGRVAFVVLVADRPEGALAGSLQFVIAGLTLGLVFVAGAVVLSVFSLAVALAFGYLIARRLVRDLETLEGAADRLAAGELDQRAVVAAGDEIGRLAARFNDMAERLQESQAQLAREKGTAERALETRRALVANVSHELRTPVSTIRAHVEWLRAAAPAGAPGAPQDDDLARYLAIIDTQTERLGALIDDLLDLSRVETGGTAIRREAVAVEAVIGQVQASLGILAQRERRVKLTSVVPADLPPVCADAARLEQVLVNLTRNAISYTPAGGIVSLGAARAGADHVALWVADTGVGIPAAELDLVFERFYRGDASRSRHTGGAGLGLAIVRALVEAMGGTVAVESVEGEGSRFTVQLPVAR